MLNDTQRKLVTDAKKILIIQAENPDGDSLGSALALEEIFGAMDKTVALHCPVQIPTYLRHITGWDRVELDFPTDADIAIIVDTSSKILLSKTLDNPVAANFLNTHPVLVFDHHVSVEPDLPFDAQYITSDTAVATGELIFDLYQEEKWEINAAAATNLFISIQADSLGLTTAATTAESFATCAELVRLGANPADIEEKRRELMKKKPEILQYKGQLIERIEYFNDGRTAFVHVPFDEIQEYSNDYNPTMLVLDEMRLVIGVDVAIGVKTYPDGKLTGKLRSNIPVSHLAAKFFGGDGHPYAAGFRIYEKYDEFLPELIQCLDKIYADYDTENPDLIREEAIDDTKREGFNSLRVKGKK
ncbi:MAG: DHH family phosphoesterase [Candidatus Nomurabacteria bacterium]|jgi:phosphoesterase RecJ-like protein|nr:DHH family phosphoesterase [Candidatus Nomurabacteria bacterium]